LHSGKRLRPHLAVFDDVIDIVVDVFDVSRNALALPVADMVVTEGQDVGVGQRLADGVVVSCSKKMPI
jgi:hypothetical protein